MRTIVLLLCLAAPAQAGPLSAASARSRQVQANREMGPNMQWYYGGPGGGPRPTYDRRTGVYSNADGSIAAYPVKVRHHRREYVYPGR